MNGISRCHAIMTDSPLAISSINIGWETKCPIMTQTLLMMLPTDSEVVENVLLEGVVLTTTRDGSKSDNEGGESGGRPR